MKLTGVEETTLIPLWARAYETTRKGEHLIEDPTAAELINKIDYDFSKFAEGKLSQAGVAVRSAILDREARRFFAEHPKAICINLACGLDTRFQRVDNGNIQWYNLDLPHVMQLRSELIPNTNEREHEITASLFDESWPGMVPRNGEDVLIIMEGASMYFSKEQMCQFFSLAAEHFPGAFLLMEVMTPFMIKQQKHHDTVDTKKAPFLWGVTDGKEIETLHKKLRFLRQWTFYEGFRKRWGLFGLLSLIPWWNQNCNDKIVCLEIKK